jgi:hypothetical protein
MLPSAGRRRACTRGRLRCLAITQGGYSPEEDGVARLVGGGAEAVRIAQIPRSHGAIALEVQQTVASPWLNGGDDALVLDTLAAEESQHGLKRRAVWAARSLSMLSDELIVEQRQDAPCRLCFKERLDLVLSIAHTSLCRFL